MVARRQSIADAPPATRCLQTLAHKQLARRRRLFEVVVIRHQLLYFGLVGIMDHVANCLELGIDLKQEPRDHAEGDNRQKK